MPKADGTMTDQEKAQFYGGLAKEVGPTLVEGIKSLIEAAKKHNKKKTTK